MLKTQDTVAPSTAGTGNGAEFTDVEKAQDGVKSPNTAAGGIYAAQSDMGLVPPLATSAVLGDAA